MEIKKDIAWRAYFLFALITMLAIAVVFQLISIQFINGKQYRDLVEEYTTVYREVPAARGNIYDENNNLLATSLPFFEIRFDTKADGIKPDTFKKYRDSLAFQLANTFNDISAKEYAVNIQKAYNSNNRYYLLKRKVNYIEYKALQKMPLLKKGKNGGGLIAVQSSKRVLPFQNLALRTIGYVRDTTRAESVGLELSMNKYLAGQDGNRLMQKIPGGWIPIEGENEIEPINGLDIVTTLDIKLQDIADNALRNALIKHNADHGCAIVMETETGKIKALVNLTNHNGNCAEDYNYAIAESVEPGSTFKTSTYLAMLEDDVLNFDEKVDISQGTWNIYGQTVHDAETHDKLPQSNVTEVFAVSSNIGAAKLIEKYYKTNPNKFIEKLQQFHLHEKTGIDLKGEQNPYIKTVNEKSWSRVSLPWMSFGYEVSLTPLQIACFYNTIANNGKMMKPYLVNQVKKNNRVIESFKPITVDKSIASKNTIKKIQYLLRQVFENEHGTAHSLNSSYIKLSGKTGTTQIASGKRGYKLNAAHRSSIAGFFPSDNPKYTCVVVISNPVGEYYGGKVAGPVFKEIAEKYFAHQSIETENITNILIDSIVKLPNSAGLTEEINKTYDKLHIAYNNDTESEYVAYSNNENSVKANERKILNNTMPNLKGFGMRDALFILENYGLNVKTVGKGKVIEQSPEPNSTIKRGNYVLLKFE